MGAYDFLTQTNPYSAVQTMAVGQRAKENRLADLARQYAGEAMGGDQNALAKLGGVDPSMALNIKQEDRLGKQFTQQEKLQRLDEIASVYNQATTPEQFQSAVKYFQGKGYNLDPEEMDFNNRQNVVAQAMSLKDQIAQATGDRDFNATQDYRRESLALQREGLNQKAEPTVAADVGARKTAAADLGLSPEDPRYQAYVLTGKMPREDTQDLTATDKKFIAEADELAFASQNAVDMLKSALNLNDKAGYGATAGAQAWAARNDPTGGMIFDQGKGAATTEFSNLVLNQALGQLKAIFGAAPTEGERAILVDLQASVDKSPIERKAILDRAVQLAQRRMEFYQSRSKELRGGEFYKPGGGLPAGGAQPQPVKTKGGGDMSPENIQTMIDQANKAVQAGADPAAVKARLAEMGIEVE